MKTGASIGPSVSLSAVVIRACSECGSPRELAKPCAGCGNPKPARVSDLGVIASSARKSWRARLAWKLYGYHAAQRRIRRVNAGKA